MSPTALALPLAFLALATCVLWILAKSRGPWWGKALLTVATCGLSVAMWSTLSDLEGWPSPDFPEKEFRLLGILVEEPKEGDDGGIYVWVMEHGADRGASWMVRFRDPRDGEPRCYKLPYSRETHKKADMARRRMREGRMVMLRLRRLPHSENGGRPGGTGNQRKPGAQAGRTGTGRTGREPVCRIPYGAEFRYPLPSATWRKD